METVFNYGYEKGHNTGKAFFSSDEQKWISKIRSLKESHPDEVTILAEPETNDGCIYCSLPQSWLKVQPKVKINLTEEQREARRQHLLAVRNSKA